MPTSDVSNLSPIATEIVKLAPRTVLDLGVGCGKYGAICREYLDLMHGRFDRKTWLTKIIGVEGFDTYRNPMWDMYNSVIINDFTDKALYKDLYTGFDLVMMNDTLEHLDKAVGLELLLHLVQNNKRVLVSTPDSFYAQTAVHGNDFEVHRSQWHDWEMQILGKCRLIHKGVCFIVVLEKQ